MSQPATKPDDDASVDLVADAAVTEETQTAEGWGFTRSYRLGIGVLCAVLLVYLVIVFWNRPARLDQSPATTAAFTLPTRVDPNVASWQELARIPHLGEAIAKRIVAWRDEQRSQNNARPFEKLEDLDRVPGLGPKTIARFRAYLDFPEERPADVPASQPTTMPDVEIESVIVPLTQPKP